MKKSIFLLLAALVILTVQCRLPEKKDQKGQNMSSIQQKTVDSTIKMLVTKYGEVNLPRIRAGVEQAAALWTKADGKNSEFTKFCVEHFAGNDKAREELFLRISDNFEILWGNFNKMSLDLKRPQDVDQGIQLPIDEFFGGYEPSAHLIDDFFNNKIAFITILNFPCYSLREKTELGKDWDRKQWAYARLGDVFTSRVPSELILKVAQTLRNSDTYISSYNIYMGNLIGEKGDKLFPADLKLISHWGLRDELKAQYGNADGLEKQRMIYEVMKRIIRQDIPAAVVNNETLQWNPYTNLVFENGKQVSSDPEVDRRYRFLLDNFKALKEVDVYSPQYPTYISRKFDQEMEIPQEEVEKLFIEYISSPQVKKVAALISKRLNRKLEPFDIWFDGFKSRSSISQDELDQKVRSKYPTREAFEKGLPVILTKLQWPEAEARAICEKIAVDPSRGAGHAWGAMMKGDKAHLRTRIQPDGMNYKGYNIALHEFGHTVEQTISLYNVDYYFLNGVPNTAFTEALAFIFQKRDLEVLGIKNDNPDKWHYMALDNFWANYEIMGVSLVDMRVWKWMYEHPGATAAELKEAVISIATDVWNNYYADVFGIKDQPILAVYSHMIDAPLYLSAYPVGHLIDFQLEMQLEGKNFAQEVSRIYKTGRLIPEYWMKEAVGEKLSIKPMLEAADKALMAVDK